MAIQSFAGSFDLPTSGTVTVSGLPFAPTFVYMAHANRTGFGGDATSGSCGSGFTDGTNHRSISVSSPLGLSANDKVVYREDSVTHRRDSWRSAITLTSDGFSMTPAAYPAVATKHVYIAFADVGSVAVGTETQKTSTGIKSTAVGFAPTLVLFLGCQTTVVDTLTSNGTIVYGILTATQEGVTWCSTQDLAGTSNTQRYATMSKAMFHAQVGSTILAEADGALTATGFDLDWTTADAVARQFGYAAMQAVSTDVVDRQSPAGAPTVTYTDRAIRPRALISISAAGVSYDVFADSAANNLGFGGNNLVSGGTGYVNQDNLAQPTGRADIEQLAFLAGAAPTSDRGTVTAFSSNGETVSWSNSTLGDHFISLAIGDPVSALLGGGNRWWWRLGY